MKTDATQTAESEVAGFWEDLWQPVKLPAKRDFSARAEEAVQRGLGWRKMAAASRELGFMGMPLDFYLLEVAHRAKVPPALVTEPFVQRGSNLWISLAKVIALPLREARLMVRAMFAQSLTPAAVNARFRRSPLANTRPRLFQPEAAPESYSAQLDVVEKVYSVASLQNLAELLVMLETP